MIPTKIRCEKLYPDKSGTMIAVEYDALRGELIIHGYSGQVEIPSAQIDWLLNALETIGDTTNGFKTGESLSSGDQQVSPSTHP